MLPFPILIVESIPMLSRRSGLGLGYLSMVGLRLAFAGAAPTDESNSKIFKERLYVLSDKKGF